MDDIAKRSIEIIAKAKTSHRYHPTRHHLEELNIDSLDKINISFEVEEAFSIEIPDEALGSLKTVGDVVNASNSSSKQSRRLSTGRNVVTHRSPLSNVNRVVITGLGALPHRLHRLDFRESLFSG